MHKGDRPCVRSDATLNREHKKEEKVCYDGVIVTCK
jgi:hypothetical protein